MHHFAQMKPPFNSSQSCARVNQSPSWIVAQKKIASNFFSFREVVQIIYGCFELQWQSMPNRERERERINIFNLKKKNIRESRQLRQSQL